MYKLLVFNEDYADEHNIPALACFTEDGYQEWLKSPSGRKNKDYEKQLIAYEEAEEKDKQFWQTLEEKGYVLNGHPNTSMIPKTDIETLELEKEYRIRNDYRTRIKYPTKVSSWMRSWLGNGGECFEEAYNHLYLMKEFVEKGLVKVYDVDENFYNMFNKAELSRLSLCNVFEIECDEDEDDDFNFDNED